MNTILEFVQGTWAQALGFTVLHSLWQGLIIFMMVVGILRCVPSRLSGLRYSVAGAGMVLIFCSAAVTFFLLYSPVPTVREELLSGIGQTGEAPTSLLAQASFTDWLATVSNFLHSTIPFVVLAWVAGSILFLLRLFGGWWFTARLKHTALPLTNTWSFRIAELAGQFELKRAVTLAESAFIHAPVVIGYLKPIILIPTGMCAGLSTAQLESIFIHELIHIRRNDYLLNLLQSIVEALFFFNPFAWMISGILRQEREHCCDDAVVLHQGNALAYAHALASLEEVRLSRAGLALSLAENKNQLLNRIKRIMEKSVKNYSLRERMAPAVLLVIGLMCASWLTVHTSRTEKDLTLDHSAIAPIAMAADTAKKKKPSHKGLRKITTTPTVTTEMTEVTEEVETAPEVDHEEIEIHNMDMEAAMDDMDMDFDIHIPPIPLMPPMPDMEPIEPLEPVAPLPPINFQWNDNKDWGAFNEAFEQKFKEQFGDFYSKNGEKMKAMMDELEKNMKESWDTEAFAHKMEALAERHADFATRQGERMAAQAERQGAAVHSEAEKQAAVARRQAERTKAHAERQAELFRAQSEKHVELAKRHEEMARKHRDTMNAMKKDLKEMLVKDGYLGKDENINSIDWSHPGDLKVNGKTVKESDKKKYEAIHQKYFNGGTFHYSEN
ncbi:M56 family metallopeptidase [Chryseolinea lacunae]|uniref:Peptidase M56 domain-containing protein n=1 Tax=Chryseolinea lacunae TaxID=2801331 RepID=A0ABS1KT38_9BACT|nr:M56 family metallopeptidase [Chryseolinea lacunae]MBL0742478.1 hypothetical protein [Chryseolinea lacunae]